jgi:uncharacterized protein YndB with AHSA1/START domain
MKKTLVFQQSIRIKATPAKVWAALTSPALTKKFMFGGEAISDWKAGSTLTWRLEGSSKTLKGKIVALEPEKRLSYTIIDPEADYPDIPENYTTVTYELTGEKGETIVSVSDGDFAAVAEGEERYKRTVPGWAVALNRLKEVVERLA